MKIEPNQNSDEWPPEILAKVNRDRAARTAVNQQNQGLFTKITEAMFRHDPIGINFESNSDEYDPEAGTVIPRLRECTCPGDVTSVLHEEFCKWFGAENAGPKAHYATLADEIWELWTENQTTKS
jgi:hypothetical protein